MSPSACTTPGCARSKTAFTPTTSSRKASARRRSARREFAQAVVARLGQKPEKLKAVSYKSAPKSRKRPQHQSDARPRGAEATGRHRCVRRLDGRQRQRPWRARWSSSAVGLKLIMIDNRGMKVWPDGFPETFTGTLGAAASCRRATRGMQHSQIIDLLGRIQAAGVDFVKIESLYNFDGQPGYSLGQGQ